jgi:hypothetical protein
MTMIIPMASSSTRNIAFGSGSTTVPRTSITSRELYNVLIEAPYHVVYPLLAYAHAWLPSPAAIADEMFESRSQHAFVVMDGSWMYCDVHTTQIVTPCEHEAAKVRQLCAEASILTN